MRVPPTPLILCGSQFVSYAILVWNMRSVADGNLGMALLSDGLFQTVGFFMFRKLVKVTEEDSLLNWLGYTTGGLLGTTLGMRL